MIWTERKYYPNVKFHNPPLDWHAAHEQQPIATTAVTSTVTDRTAIHNVDEDHSGGETLAKSGPAENSK